MSDESIDKLPDKLPDTVEGFVAELDSLKLAIDRNEAELHRIRLRKLDLESMISRDKDRQFKLMRALITHFGGSAVQMYK